MMTLNIPTRSVQCLLIFIFACFWELLPRSGVVPPIFLPSLSATLAAGYADIGDLSGHLMTTLGEVGLAVTISCLSGVVAGLLVGISSATRPILIPMASSAYAIPIVILYPIITAWLGVGVESKIVFGGFYGFFPAFLSVAAGVHSIPAAYVLTGRSLGASRFSLAWYVLVPAALPTILGGIRLGGALAIVGVIVGEMLTSSSGLGYYISYNRTMMDTPKVYAGIILVILLTVVFDSIIGFLQWLTDRRR
ncbi:TPA: ABC transporter permease [Klebsiella michiganensis]